MIDIQAESVITLKEAAAKMPGKPRSVQTVYRWTKVGVKGVILEATHVGGILCTSWEAIQRFSERIDAVKKGDQPPVRSSLDRKRAVERAKEQLKEMGFFKNSRNAKVD